jgi:hypothetical protein
MRSLPCTLVVALCLGGCGAVATPSHSRATHRSPISQAEATHEYPSNPVAGQTAAAASRSAVAAISAFASAYINWDASTVAKDLRALAGRSLGQARAAMQLAAAQVTSDYELRRGGIANHGTIEAVAPLRAGSNRYVVVTRELTTAKATTAYQGLEPAWHVTLVTVTRESSGRWVVSGWQPEN